jgi:hypothetical protein
VAAGAFAKQSVGNMHGGPSGAAEAAARDRQKQVGWHLIWSLLSLLQAVLPRVLYRYAFNHNACSSVRQGLQPSA